ncbi:Nn.00g080340.m01.CDS01 [Neocucurbitaria sp. VM-36]
MRADSRPNRKPKWEIITEIRISVGVDEVKRSAVVLFDPQCPKDVISTRFLRNFPGLDYERSSESIGCSITGGERFKSIGRVEIRWHCGKRKPSLSRSPVYYLNCFEESTCLVVESEKFEVMIGRPAIEKLELYRSNHPLVAAFRGVTIGTDSTHDKQAQQAADIARKQAEQKQRQREKELEEKKEKERRKKESSKKK